MQTAPLFVFLQYDCGMRTTTYFYILAKMCELYDLTNRIISGYTMKHLIAGCAVKYMFPTTCE